MRTTNPKAQGKGKSLAFFDIETDGLKPTKIHCMAYAIDEGEVKLAHTAEELSEAVFLLEGHRLCAHNGIEFDVPVCNRLLGMDWDCSVDTIVLSRLFHPDRLAGHSLEAWGVELGVAKTDYLAAWLAAQPDDYVYSKDDEWKEYNPIMGEYCKQDVVVLRALYNKLKGEHKPLWNDSIKMETRFAKDFELQAEHGVVFDSQKANFLIDEIDARMAEIESTVKLPEAEGSKVQLAKWIPPKLQFKNDGQPSAVAHRWFDELSYREDAWWGRKEDVWVKLPTPALKDGTRLPIKTTFQVELKDQAKIKAWLMEKGWKPTAWSFKKKPDKNGVLRVVKAQDGTAVVSQPKLHVNGDVCPNLQKMQVEGVREIVEWMVLRHRRGLLNSLLLNVRDDGRIAAEGIALGTPTSRVRHRVVANIPKAKDSVPYGKEIRSCFKCADGYEFCNVDASGLELRCLAHYINNPITTDIILNGDVHEHFTAAYRKVWDNIDREGSKPISYGALYGASGCKLAETAGIMINQKELGEGLKQAFRTALPGLENLIKAVEAASNRGWLKAIDGRIIPIRSKHSALNSLLQSCGSILVKNAQCYMNHQMRRRHLQAWQVISYHDEVCIEGTAHDAELSGQLFVKGLQWAASKYGFRVPLTGDVKMGQNWSIH